MIKTIKKYLSGSLNAFILSAIFGLSIHSVYADEITNTNNYLPNGKYRLFGNGRGEVQNIHNNIHLHGQLTQQAGNLQIETRLYQGNLSYEQHFNNHGHQVHSPFSNTAQRNFSAKKGSIVQGGATLTDLSVTGYEIHPADAYDGEQGGGYPVPTGARDEYLYEVNGKEVGVKVLALDKLPNKTDDNQLLRQAGIDPAPYNKPQNSDDRTQIQRLSGVGGNTHNSAYSHLSDINRNGYSWDNAEIRQPESFLYYPEQHKKYDNVVFNTVPIVYEIPSASTRLTDEYGNIITVSKYSAKVDNNPRKNNKNSVMTTVVPEVIVTRSPYDRLNEANSNYGKSTARKNSNGLQSKGNDDSQTDYDNPPIFGYLDDDYGDDDLFYYQTTDNYYGNSFVGYNDDYDPYPLDTDALNALNIDDENNAYPINSPYGLAYYSHQNEQNSENSWWEYFIPGYGDYLSFKEAENGWDYFLATAGIVWKPARGAKIVSKGSKAGKAVDKADDAVGAGSKAAGKNKSQIDNGTIYVDSKGNAIPTPKGGSISGSPDGKFIQVRDQNGKLTGARIDGGHNSASHPDPRAQTGHAHVPGVTNNDGTPWLPIKQ